MAVETLLEIFLKAADLPELKRELTAFQFPRFCDLLLATLEYTTTLKVRTSFSLVL